MYNSDVQIPPQLSQAADRLNRSCSAFATAVATHGIPAFRALAEEMDRLRPIIEELDRLYKESGAIYGDSPEGFMRWLQDMGEIARHQQAIREIEQRQRQVMLLRSILE